jgi:toxin ParE1/3/4
MNRPLIIRPAAEDDLAEAKAWYDAQRDGLGDELLVCVEEALDRIRRMPEAPAVIFEGARRVLVRRFPYAVIYRVDDDQISVLAIYHTRRDPRDWQLRI